MTEGQIRTRVLFSSLSGVGILGGVLSLGEVTGLLQRIAAVLDIFPPPPAKMVGTNDSPITIRGGSIITRTADNAGWVEVTGSPGLYKSIVPDPSFKQALTVKLEGHPAFETGLTAPWEIDITNRSNTDAIDPSSTHGIKICSDPPTPISGGSYKCKQSGSAASDATVYMVLMDGSDQLAPASFDEDGFGNDISSEGHHRMIFHHGGHTTSEYAGQIIINPINKAKVYPCPNSACVAGLSQP